MCNKKLAPGTHPYLDKIKCLPIFTLQSEYQKDKHKRYTQEYDNKNREYNNGNRLVDVIGCNKLIRRYQTRNCFYLLKHLVRVQLVVVL